MDEGERTERIVERWSAINAGMAKALGRALNYKASEWLVGDRLFRLDEKVLVMGILNMTPDSFYDGGRHFHDDRAIRHALDMIEQGADIVDIGGESTRPGAAPLSENEELRRTLNIVEELATRDIPISIDTYHPSVAQSAVNAGARIINDVSGFRNKKMIEVMAKSTAAGVIMHMLGEPRTMQKEPFYTWSTGEIALYLAESLDMLNAAGIQDRRLAVDPGIGFGKQLPHNLELIRDIRALCGLGRPILIGVSRKSFIGDILGLPVEDRLEGSLAAAAAAVMNGARIVRVHDVEPTVRLVRVLEKIHLQNNDLENIKSP